MTTQGAPRSVLTEFSDGLAAAVERAAVSTVTVKARRWPPASGVIWSADGVIVTADHVIEREDEILIGLPGGREVRASIAGRDPGTDLAVLRVETTGLTAAERAPDDGIRVGHLVLALGRPLPSGPMASLGVISTLGPWGMFRRGRGRLGGHGQDEIFIRSDVTFYPGFSGGPLVDGEGRVLGVNSSRLGFGAGLTVRAAAVARIADLLLRGGRIRRGYLGVGTQPVRLSGALAQTAGAGQETGLLIVTVEPGSPAERAGLLVGDILVGMAGAPVRDTDDLQAQLGPDRVGQATSLTVLRGGERRELTVTVGERT
jgi:S1-C subfamily serine protease